MTPKFKFDELLEAEDICNLKFEASILRKNIQNAKKMVIYARRNMGKTSLVKNVIAKEFIKKNPGAFVLFVDFMEVKTFESIQNRINRAFAAAFSQSFPAKKLMNGVQKFLGGLRPIMEIDPVSGMTSFSIGLNRVNNEVSMADLFKIIREKIAIEKKTLLVFDEFQDISLVPEASGRLREELQKLSNIPVLILGSKKHLLANMFAHPDAPFADFGSDLEFKPIAYEEYHQYLLERFKPFKLSLNFETSCYFQDQLQRLPESINIVGAYIVDHYSKQEITKEVVQHSIVATVSGRLERFETLLAALSETEEKILISIANTSPVAEPTGKLFLSKINLSHGTVRTVFTKLENKGFIERTKQGFVIANPLLHCYLIRFR